MISNIPVVKLGMIAVSRDCFPIALSEKRRAAIKAAFGEGLYECPVTVENELDMLRAVEDVKAKECNALVVFLGNHLTDEFEFYGGIVRNHLLCPPMLSSSIIFFIKSSS